ncbi:MAG TPA: nucleotidyl transferase AbiEii/AbiGii toxin family protein [Solirubrobacteraceae bacterium]|nr:nucleotidyl transferase AbiEii/AbiGii toxin family protein [Solirubrobacteraceae bacterium]
MSEPALPEKILAVHASLTGARIGHAFGGALALAYYAEPRATIDIDMNVFLAPSSWSAVEDALGPLGVAPLDGGVTKRDGQCRTWWGETPIDLFFAYDDIHTAMRRAARTVPFGGDRLPVLAPEHLLVCKATFDRPKDWLDIEQMVACVEDLDVEEIRSWLTRIVGSTDPRMQRLEQIVAELAPG